MSAGGTAQDAYRRMLREYVAPSLRELGFRRGPSLGAFRVETTTHAAEVRFIKSRYSSKQEVDFWADLHASDIKAEWLYWERTLRDLSPELLSPWTVEAGSPVEPVAREVLQVFRDYGWPAIQAALDNPGYPRDPAVRWARTFPKCPRGRYPEEREATRQAWEELEEAGKRADTDPSALQTLLAHLETDPDPAIRRSVAWWLLHRAHEERCRQALRAAAAEDEDVEVRWVARYALRLAEDGMV